MFISWLFLSYPREAFCPLTYEYNIFTGCTEIDCRSGTVLYFSATNIRQDICLPMCCPFILRHSLTRSGMPHMNRSKGSGEIADHALFTFWIKPFQLVAAGILSSSCWTMAYKFSIRFKSGEFPGYWSFVQKELTFDWSHRWVMIAVWLGALSCIKIASDISSMNFFSKVEPVAWERHIAGRSDFSRISDT